MHSAGAACWLNYSPFQKPSREIPAGECRRWCSSALCDIPKNIPEQQVCFLVCHILSSDPAGSSSPRDRGCAQTEPARTAYQWPEPAWHCLLVNPSSVIIPLGQVALASIESECPDSPRHSEDSADIQRGARPSRSTGPPPHSSTRNTNGSSTKGRRHSRG